MEEHSRPQITDLGESFALGEDSSHDRDHSDESEQDDPTDEQASLHDVPPPRLPAQDPRAFRNRKSAATAVTPWKAYPPSACLCVVLRRNMFAVRLVLNRPCQLGDYA